MVKITMLNRLKTSILLHTFIFPKPAYPKFDTSPFYPLIFITSKEFAQFQRIKISPPLHPLGFITSEI
jgi:hypothetical protein